MNNIELETFIELKYNLSNDNIFDVIIGLPDKLRTRIVSQYNTSNPLQKPLNVDLLYKITKEVLTEYEQLGT
jgi:hypothetical protein